MNNSVSWSPSVVSFMPALIQSPDGKLGTLAAYGEFLSCRLTAIGRAARPRPVRTAGGPPWRGRAKRAIDVVGASLLLLLLAPVATLLVGLVWLDGGSPIFGHERTGRGGRPFRCWKIRTMLPDAAARLDALLAADPGLAAEWRRDHKLRRDPRVTRLGRLLRRTSLDEVPQLWNVLIGEMSLVGPRPVTAAELARYRGSARHYLAVRPGLTGMWQLDGRKDLPYARRVLLDRFYVMRPSIGRDVALLARTPLALVGRGGC